MSDDTNRVRETVRVTLAIGVMQSCRHKDRDIEGILPTPALEDGARIACTNRDNKSGLCGLQECPIADAQADAVLFELSSGTVTAGLRHALDVTDKTAGLLGDVVAFIVSRRPRPGIGGVRATN